MKRGHSPGTVRAQMQERQGLEERTLDPQSGVLCHFLLAGWQVGCNGDNGRDMTLGAEQRARPSQTPAARAQRAALGERLVDRALALLRHAGRPMTDIEIATKLGANPKSGATVLGTLAKGNRSVVRRVPAFEARR